MKKLIIGAMFLYIPAALASPVCVGGTLAQFITRGTCSFPGSTGLLFSNWSTTASNGVNPSNVMLTPTDGSGSGFVISAPMLSTGSGPLTLAFGYTVSGSSITRATAAIAGFGTSRNGSVQGNTGLCEGAAFSGTACSGTGTGITLSPSNSSGHVVLSGSGVTQLGVTDTLTVNGNAAVSLLSNTFVDPPGSDKGSGDDPAPGGDRGRGDDTGGGAAVPEPASLLLLGSGLLLIALKFVRKEARR